MTIIQQQVMDQTKGAGGTESCGYHTLKNSLLNLLYFQGKITAEQLERMLNDPNLFKAIFDKTKKANNNAGELDVSLARFVELLKQAKNGELDFSAYGVSHDVLQELNLNRDGNQDLSAVNTMTGVVGFDYALLGMEEDLFSGAAVVKLARHKGAVNHVFAVGINNEHWVSASLQQNALGERTWRFMDSWKNQSIYKYNVILKIEAVLNKNELQLKNYLLSVYENSSNLFNRRYNLFFENTGRAKQERFAGFGSRGDKSVNAKEFFIEDKSAMVEFSSYIENRFIFMQTTGWLTNTDKKEQGNVARLYHMAKFIVDNADATNPWDEKVIQKLSPICAQIISSKSMTLDSKPASSAEETIPAPVPAKPTFQEKKPVAREEPAKPAFKEEKPVAGEEPAKPAFKEDIPVAGDEPAKPAFKEDIPDGSNDGSKKSEKMKEEASKPRSATDEESRSQEPKPVSASDEEDDEAQQTDAAQSATQNQKPKATERFCKAFVTAIKSMIQGIKDAFSYVAKGIKSVF